MNVVIIGCGRVGSGLATTLAHDHHDVTIVDRDARMFQRRLDPDFPGTKLVGNGMTRMCSSAPVSTRPTW